ncbi:MAG: glycosyltransferase [Methanoregula sp.]|jgi:glycosyltransferase involved in cell wall biosynthesis
MISVIIPALNEQGSIDYCLRSLLEQTIDRDSYEIIVVDGGSGDRTRDIAGQYADLVISQKRGGIGGARGDGVEASQGDILVFTDADTLHRRNWLELIRENLTGQGYDVSTGPVLFYDRTFRSELIQLWRKQYKIFHLFGFYWLIGSNVAMKRDAYDRIDGHRDISLLEDYDLSVRMFKEGDIACYYDPRQAVYTSARRLGNLLSYMMIYMYGHYHYHVTKNPAQLLQYPRFDAMDLRLISGIIGMKQVNEKISSSHAKFMSTIEKLDRRL